MATWVACTALIHGGKQSFAEVTEHSTAEQMDTRHLTKDSYTHSFLSAKPSFAPAGVREDYMHARVCW